jgi:hypothetical protein
MIIHDKTWYDMIWHDMTWYDMNYMIWHDMTWMTRYDMIWREWQDMNDMSDMIWPITKLTLKPPTCKQCKEHILCHFWAHMIPKRGMHTILTAQMIQNRCSLQHFDKGGELGPKIWGHFSTNNCNYNYSACTVFGRLQSPTKWMLTRHTKCVRVSNILFRLLKAKDCWRTILIRSEKCLALKIRNLNMRRHLFWC